MLRVHVVNRDQDEQFALEAGPFELGRGSPREAKRFMIRDDTVSRDHLRLEECPGNRVRLVNLSRSQKITMPDGTFIDCGVTREFALPVRVPLGHTIVDLLSSEDESPVSPDAPPDQAVVDN